VTIPNGARTLGTAAFVPNPVTVSVGSTVTWTNSDTASSNHDVVADGGAFDSGLFGNGKSFSFTFQSRGTFTYHCSIHAGMVGTVVVQ
jgi:plastocyanin